MPRPRRSTALTLAAAWTLMASLDRPLQARPAPPPSPRCGRLPIGPLVADVPSVEVQPQFRLNGKPFPGAASGVAHITLWASRPSPLFDGPQLSLGQTDEPPQAVRVVPGVYDVYYSWMSGDGVPRNHLTRVLQGVSIREDGVLAIDVRMIEVSGEKRHNGVTFAEDGSAAALSLRSEEGRGDVPLGGTLPPEFSVRIIPGTYRLHYDWIEGATLPRNRRMDVRTLRLSRDRSHLVLDVPSVAQDFVFLHNGEPFPPSEIESGDIVLGGHGRDEVRIGRTSAPPPTVRLIPGVYDVHWHYHAGAAVPRNDDAVILEGVGVDGSPLIVDVPSVEVSGDIRLNGQLPPNSEIENGRLGLAAADGRDRADLGATRWGAYQSRVVPGSYDVVYEHLAGATIVPANPRATFVHGWDVAVQPTRTLDIPVGTFEGVFLLNGQPFPDSQIESGTFYALPLAGTDAPVYLGLTRYGAFSSRLIPGSYRTAYAHDAGATIVPANAFTTFGPQRQVFQGDGPAAVAHVLDVKAAPLTVSYAHNGAPLPPGGPQNARIYLHRRENHLQLLDSSWGPADRIAMEGQFDLYYQYREGPDLPRNVLMPFGCWALVR